MSSGTVLIGLVGTVPNRAASRAGTNVNEVLFFVDKVAQSCPLAA